MSGNGEKDIFEKKLYYRRLWNHVIFEEPSQERLVDLREYAQSISVICKPSSLILDVGCGSGTLLRMLESKGCRNVIGVEVANRFLRTEGSSFIVAETTHFSFRPGSVDLIFARRFVSVSDVRKSLEEFYDVLKENGKLIIDVTNVKSLKSRINTLLGLTPFSARYYPYLYLESFKEVLIEKNFIILYIKGDYVHIPFIGKILSIIKLGGVQRVMRRKMLTLCLHISAFCIKRPLDRVKYTDE